MSVEAALLGVPSIRYSDFAGKISVLNELEEYGLTFGVTPGDDDQLAETARHIIETRNRKAEYQQRRKRMLSDKIDVTAFFTWLLGEYPDSVLQLKKKPDEIERFRFERV